MRRHVLLGFALAAASSFVVACGGGGGDADARPTTDPDAADPIDAEPGPTCPGVTMVSTAAARELTVIDDTGSTRGIFDPSVVYPVDAPQGAMSYSSVPTQHTIQTRIALSPDEGATWTYVADANQPEPITIETDEPGACIDGICEGNLISEVSSLVRDDDDPDAARRWKLFSHRYFAENDDTLHYRYGNIVLQTAPAPAGPWTAPAPLLGWDSPIELSSDGVVFNASDDPDLADCLVLTEPGALWRPVAGGGSTIDLALGCVYLDGTGPLIRIVLLRSADHAATWSYVSAPLLGTDAVCVEGNDVTRTLNAATLFVDGGDEYLVASPAHGGSQYAGCLVFAVDDPEAGTVRRDQDGQATVVRTLGAAQGDLKGACDYAEGATAMGYTMSIARFSQAKPFRVYRSTVLAP